MNKESIKAASITSVAGMMLVGVASIAGNPAPVAAPSEQVATDETESYACTDVLAQDDSVVLALANADAASADCMFVGCGGIF